MHERIKVITPVITILVNSNIATMSYPEKISIVNITIGNRLILQDGTNIYLVEVIQNQYKNGSTNEIKGKIILKSHNFTKAKENYDNDTNGSTGYFIEKDLENIILEYYIVPSIKDLTENYKYSLALKNIDVAKFNTSSISKRWDDIMNGNTDEFKEKVIGHERIKEEVIAAILSGKNVMLYGPPGTGKTMIATRISKVFDCESRTYTANAQWTSDDTVGGYTLIIDNNGKEKLVPVNGCITEVIYDCNSNIVSKFYNLNSNTYVGKWAIIDEINRAKMDFAFGALFTALDQQYSILELPQYKNTNQQNIQIYIPQTFRIVGTMNNFDKNFLFKFSYALSRRFAHIYVGVPLENEYTNELTGIVSRLKNELSENFNKPINTFDDLETDDGYKKIVDLIGYIRGYGSIENIRDLGTAQVIDTIKLYCIEKYIMNVLEIDNRVDMAINSIIIPSLEGVMDSRQLEAIIIKFGSLSRTKQSLENFKKINY